MDQPALLEEGCERDGRGAGFLRDYPLAPDTQLTLVGYSGGGVLAMHLALCLQRVSNVITIAAPLDMHAWTDLHDYTPLQSGSNPADFHEWPQRLEQVHLIGGQDRNVPPSVAASFVSSAGSDEQHITTRTHPEFDTHVAGSAIGRRFSPVWPRLAGP